MSFFDFLFGKDTSCPNCGRHHSGFEYYDKTFKCRGCGGKFCNCCSKSIGPRRSKRILMTCPHCNKRYLDRGTPVSID